MSGNYYPCVVNYCKEGGQCLAMTTSPDSMAYLAYPKKTDESFFMTASVRTRQEARAACADRGARLFSIETTDDGWYKSTVDGAAMSLFVMDHFGHGTPAAARREDLTDKDNYMWIDNLSEDKCALLNTEITVGEEDAVAVSPQIISVGCHGQFHKGSSLPGLCVATAVQPSLPETPAEHFLQPLPINQARRFPLILDKVC